MGPKEFKRWRKSLDMSQKDAAEKLGVKRRVVQYYEKGERDGKKVAIPKSIRLACWALSQGQDDYDGPPEEPVEAGSATDVQAPEKEADDAEDAAAEPPAAKDGGKKKSKKS